MRDANFKPKGKCDLARAYRLEGNPITVTTDRNNRADWLTKALDLVVKNVRQRPTSRWSSVKDS